MFNNNNNITIPLDAVIPAECITYSGMYTQSQQGVIAYFIETNLSYKWLIAIKPSNVCISAYIINTWPEASSKFPQLLTISKSALNNCLTTQMKTCIPRRLLDILWQDPNWLPPELAVRQQRGETIPHLDIPPCPYQQQVTTVGTQQQQQQSIDSFLNMQQQQYNQQQNGILDDTSMAPSTAASMAMSTGNMSSYTTPQSVVAMSSAHSRPTGVMSTSPGVSAQQIQSRRQQCSGGQQHNFAMPSYTNQQTHVGSYGVQQQPDEMSVAMSTSDMSMPNAYTTQQPSMTGPRFANQGRCQQQRFADDASVGANSHMSIDQSVSGKSQQVYHHSGNNMRPFSNDQAGISGYNHQQQLPTINDSIQQSNHVPTGFHSSTPDNGSDCFQRQEQVVHQTPSVWNQYRDGSASSRKAKRRRGEETPDDALPVASLPHLRHNARVNPDLVKKYLSLPLEELMKLEVMQVESEDDMMDLTLDGYSGSVESLLGGDLDEVKFRRVLTPMLASPGCKDAGSFALDLLAKSKEPVASAGKIAKTLNNQIAFPELLLKTWADDIDKEKAEKKRQMEEEIAKIRRDFEVGEHERNARKSELTHKLGLVLKKKSYVEKVTTRVMKTSQRANLISKIYNCHASNQNHNNEEWLGIGEELLPLVRGFEDSLLRKCFPQALLDQSAWERSRVKEVEDSLAGLMSYARTQLDISTGPNDDDQSAVTLPTFFANGVTASNDDEDEVEETRQTESTTVQTTMEQQTAAVGGSASQAHGHVLPTTTSVEETPFQSASTSNGPKADDDSLLSFNMNMSVNSSVAPPLATGIHTAVQKTPVFKSADVSDNVSTTDTEATEMSMGLKSIPSITGSSVKASATSGVPGRQQGGPTLPTVEDGKLIWFIFLLSSTMCRALLTVLLFSFRCQFVRIKEYKPPSEYEGRRQSFNDPSQRTRLMLILSAVSWWQFLGWWYCCVVLCGVSIVQ